MNDRDVDKLLEQALSGGRAQDVFRQQVLRDSTAALGAGRVTRVRWRVAGLSAAAVLIAAVSFLSGRASSPPAALEATAVAKRAADDAQTVSVPGELVAWLDAARFFKQLGMEQRVSLAYERAGQLVPHEAPLAGNAAGVAYAARIGSPPDETDDDSSESPVRETTVILAHSFGG